MKKLTAAKKTIRKRYSDEYRAEALKLAECMCRSKTAPICRGPLLE